MLDPVRVFPGVMERFDKVSQLKCSGIRWFRCPAHSDDTPSGWCFVHPDSKMLVLKCFRGCNQILIMRSVGLARKDIHMEGTRELKWIKHGTYEYHNSDGSTAFRVVRFHAMDGDQRITKKFTQEAWSGTGWRNNVNGVIKPLYRQPQLVESISRFGSRKLVWFVEGEIKCDAVRSLGLTATTMAGGGNTKIQAHQSILLSGCRVVLCVDNDSSGEEWVRNLLFDLLRAASPPKSVSIMEFPELPRHGDIGDVVANGLKVESKDCVRDKLLRRAAALREIKS